MVYQAGPRLESGFLQKMPLAARHRGGEKDMNYEEAVSFLEQIPRFRGGDALEIQRRLLAAMGSPQDRIKTVHVAGTNGKGTVCACMAKVLEEAGLKTGLFTSPHLVRINERIKIGGENISDEDFLEALDAVLKKASALEEKEPSLPPYFGMLHAIALWYFDRERTDCAVIETGLGGRLDLTNVVKAPAVCVITAIGLDHTAYLGDTPEKIAWEKAGIIKPHVPVVFDGNDPRTARVILERAAEVKAPAFAVDRSMIRDFRRTDKGIAFVLNNRYYDNIPVEVPFSAPFQADDAALALTAIRVMDPDRLICSDEEALEAAAHTNWPGRLQKTGSGLILDGAHNPHAVRALCEWIGQEDEAEKMTLLFAASSDKDCAKIVDDLAAAAPWRAVVVTGNGSSRGADPAYLASLFKERTASPVEICPDVPGAVAMARQLAGEGEVLVTGSLYLVGAVLALEGEDTLRRKG